MQSLAFVTFIVTEKILADVKVFYKPRHLSNQKHINYLLWTRISIEQFILYMIFLVYVATIQHFNNSKQESRSTISNLYFCHTLRPWKNVKVIKPPNNENVVPELRYNHAKFERSCFNSVKEKDNVKIFSKRENLSMISLEHVRK